MVSVAILGASGYTGAELLRLLLRHPQANIRVLTAERNAGKKIGSLFPQFTGADLPVLVATDQADYANVDVVFCCLPHATTQAVIASLPKHVRIIDLSADFRLRNPAAYALWYKHEHQAIELQKEAVYGLTEWNREAVKKARLIANPGCYPTSVLMPLLPLLEKKKILPTGIVADSKSGVTGAGRAAKEETLFCEVSDGIHAYGIASHRHAPEIEQELSAMHGAEMTITFTPHLMPMNRGILSTIYVTLEQSVTAADAKQVLAQRYANEPFVRVLEGSETPATRHVRGSNIACMNVFADRIPGRAIIVSVIDNLVKGASGQAVQNMNLMFGFPETQGLEQIALFP
ncbi:MAG: N-acetyl-gamma-glutamyl-phosphate reductase [Alphaproteobacteria bacterium]|nr:N-acetyl-gamma-glutamyl-phosphate reductase [Alphaproteobacteria bacterium]